MKNLQKIKAQKKLKRMQRTKSKLFGTAHRPRLSVKRSLNHIYVQFIDDDKGKTLAFASDLELKKVQGNKTAIAAEVGVLAAKKAQDAGIKEIIFDRSANKYHGRIKALAESLRKAGLKF